MRLEWSDPSLMDLEHIRDYIAKDSEFYAAQFTSRIIDAVEVLPQHPLIGRTVPEADNPAVRELLFQNYRIIYRADADRVVILTVIHGGRDLTLLELKPWDVI